MNEKLDVYMALRVFDLIISEGVKVNDEYQLNGLSAITDFDGYTVTLFNDYVRLDIFFHQKFSFTYTNKKEKEMFMDKLSAMVKKIEPQ